MMGPTSLHNRYRRIKSRIEYQPLPWLAGVVFVLFLIYSAIPEPWRGWTDLVLTTSLMIAFLWTAKLMMQRTNIWTLRGIGFFGTIVGDAFLYGSLGIGAFIGWQAHFLNLTRACLTVGVILLIAGLRRTEHEPIVADPPTG